MIALGACFGFVGACRDMHSIDCDAPQRTPIGGPNEVYGTEKRCHCLA